MDNSVSHGSQDARRLRVFLAVSMEANPGSAVVGACLDVRSPMPRLCVLEGEVSNHHAYWAALNLALERLDGRAADLLTNGAMLVNAHRHNEAAEYALPWYALANQCIDRMRETGCAVVHVGTRTGTTREAARIRWLTERAREHLSRWAEGRL